MSKIRSGYIDLKYFIKSIYCEVLQSKNSVRCKNLDINLTLLKLRLSKSAALKDSNVPFMYFEHKKVSKTET